MTRYVVYRLCPDRRVIQETNDHGLAAASARQWASTFGEECEVWDRQIDLPIFATGRERGRLVEKERLT